MNFRDREGVSSRGLKRRYAHSIENEHGRIIYDFVLLHMDAGSIGGAKNLFLSTVLGYYAPLLNYQNV
jgi:hypothetical protein